VLGLYNCPTIVNNVETLCNVPSIVRMGASEYSRLGRPNNTGTRIWCVSGHVRRPGYYEVAGITLGQLLHDLCGGPLPGRKFKAIIPGGGSCKIIRCDERFKGKKPDGTPFEYGVDDIPLDFDGLAAAGSMSGSAGMIVMDDSVDLLEALANLMAFYAHESCGQCTPCREGSLWAGRITARMCRGDAREKDLTTLYDMAGNIGGRTVCPMGFSTTWPVQSYLEKFRDEIEAAARENRCGMPRERRLIEK